MKFRFKQEDIKASTTYSKRYLLTPEGQKAFDVMRKLGGGVWHVGTSHHNCNLITSEDNYTKEEAADKVAEIKTALKAAGIYNAVASVESYYSGGYDEPDNMKVTITMKKAYSNSEVLSSMKFRFSPEDVEACDSVMAADEGKKSMEEVVEDKLDNLADNFDYAVAGLEKLCRDGNCEAAMNIINSIADSLDASIAQIGDAVSNEA